MQKYCNCLPLSSRGAFVCSLVEEIALLRVQGNPDVCIFCGFEKLKSIEISIILCYRGHCDPTYQFLSCLPGELWILGLRPHAHKPSFYLVNNGQACNKKSLVAYITIVDP